MLMIFTSRTPSPISNSSLSSSSAIFLPSARLLACRPTSTFSPTARSPFRMDSATTALISPRIRSETSLSEKLSRTPATLEINAR